MTFSLQMKLLGAAFEHDFKKTYDEGFRLIEEAATEGMHEAASHVLAYGRKDIIDSGYGYNWARDLEVRTYPLQGRISPKPITYVFHRAPNNFAGIPQFGLTVDSTKLMWIPFDKDMMTQTRGGILKSLTLKRAWLSKPGKLSGQGLEYVSPKWVGPGTKVPLLIRKRKSHRQKMEPVFFGVHHIEIPKSWHIIEIAEEQAEALPEIFTEIFDKKADGFGNDG